MTLYFFLITLPKFYGIVAYDTRAGVAVAHAIMIAPFAVVRIVIVVAVILGKTAFQLLRDRKRSGPWRRGPYSSAGK